MDLSVEVLGSSEADDTLEAKIGVPARARVAAALRAALESSSHARE